MTRRRPWAPATCPTGASQPREHADAREPPLTRCLTLAQEQACHSLDMRVLQHTQVPASQRCVHPRRRGVVVPRACVPDSRVCADSGGVIVTRQWINECFKAKARLPEASFLCKSGDEDDDDGADDGEPAAAAAAGTRRARPQRKAKQEAQQKMEPWIVRIDSEDASLLVGDLSDEAEDVDGGDDDDDDEEGDGSARGGAKKRRAAKRKPTSPRTRRAAKRPKPNDDDEYNDDSQAQGGDDDDDDDDDDDEFDIDDEEPQDDDDDEAEDDDDDDDVASGSRGRRRAGARASARKPVTRATRQRKQPAKAVAAAAAVAPKTAVSHATKAAEPPLNNAADDEDATEDMELESKPQQPQHQHAVLSKAASTHDDPLFERHDAPPPAVGHAGTLRDSAEPAHENEPRLLMPRVCVRVCRPCGAAAGLPGRRALPCAHQGACLQEPPASYRSCVRSVRRSIALACA